jgi:protoheme IX farnesyltransferase
MRRTATRPLTRHEVTPRGALVFGVVLGVAAIAGLWLLTGALAALLTAGAIAGYVLGYTLLLKRRTPENIVWGGAAGCMPTLIGWAAVTHGLAAAPFVLFAIVFFWTPPHFWALAMRFSDDYAAAGVPMLPVVAAPAVVVRRMEVYTWLTVAASLLLWPVARTGPLYAVGAAVLGGLFLREVRALTRQVAAGGRVRPLRVFHWSITYLSLLFLWIAVAAVLGPRL